MAMKNRRVFELRLGKIGLVLFIGGMSLMLFSSFLIGLVVGKHMEAYPERYSSGIPELIRDHWFGTAPKGRKVASQADQGEKDGPVGDKHDFGLTFYDTLGGKKGVMAEGNQTRTLKDNPPEIGAGQAFLSKGAMGVGSTATISGGIAGETTPRATSGEEALKRVNTSTDGKRAGEAKEKKTPAEEAETQQKGRFEVQASAYRERLQAEQLVKKFATFGFSSRVVMKEIPGKGQWFRVIVGGYESREKAQEAADQMAGKVRGLKCVIRASGKNGNGG
jgi:cell division septation protein DedD